MKKALIIDLDGTLANIEHRRQYVDKTKGKRDFGKFNKEIPKDKLNNWCAEIINRFKHDHAILIVTGREWEERVAKNTMEWLFRHGIEYTKIFARPAGDYRPDTEIKKKIYNEDILGKYDVVFCVDDRSSVVKMWRSQGLVCLQCDDGDF